MLHDNDIIEHDGARFRVEFPYDNSRSTPWENEDGHGPVSDWTTRAKRSGEIELCSDHSSKRYYDFAEACRIARHDGWGFLPGRLETVQDHDGQWHAYVRNLGNGKLTQLEAKDPDINAAIRSIYAQHRATMSAREYAAGAAMRDFDRLRAWCNDQWQYVGVVVELVDDNNEPTGETESLWGLESDDAEGMEETAHELADEIIHRLRKTGGMAA